MRFHNLLKAFRHYQAAVYMLVDIEFDVEVEVVQILTRVKQKELNVRNK